MLPGRVAAALIGRVGLLMRLHHRKRRAQSFVLDDRAGLNGLDLVEYPERQRNTLGLNREAPVRIIHRRDQGVFPVRNGTAGDR